MFDNRLFNVNGKGLPMLRTALELAFHQESYQDDACEGWTIDPKHGLILMWGGDIENKFLTKLNSAVVAEQVFHWLKTQKPESYELGDWEGNMDHDGSNSIGWRVFVGDWGHIEQNRYVLAAVKPVYLWHGK